MATTVYRVDGARQLRAAFRKAGGDLSEFRALHGQVARVVVARQRAPRRTGKLAATVRPGATRRSAVVRAGNNRATGVPYANPIHWGWAGRGITPNPWLVEAAHATEPIWARLYETELDKILRKV